jgi:hypothetical protein
MIFLRWRLMMMMMMMKASVMTEEALIHFLTNLYFP